MMAKIRTDLDSGTFDPEPYYVTADKEAGKKSYSVRELFLNAKVLDLYTRAEVEREDYRKKKNPPNVFFGLERQFRFPRGSEHPLIDFKIRTVTLNLLAMAAFVIVGFFALRESLKRQLRKV